MKITEPFIDFWFNEIGANIIPADTRAKKTHISWSVYQDNPVPSEQIEVWKKQDAFDNGMAVIAGKLWRGPYKDKYLIAIDCDNQLAIDEMCKRVINGKEFVMPLGTLAQKIIVEQHPSNSNKAHLYFISDIPFRKKSSDRNPADPELTAKLDGNEIPALEVKGEGKHGIMYCAPSPHKKGDRYMIIGTRKPMVFNQKMAEDYMNHINTICRRFGVPYLDKITEAQVTDALFDPNTVIYEGHNRHEAVLRIADKLIGKLAGLTLDEETKELVRKVANRKCVPPLPEEEFNRQWECAKKFMDKHIKPSQIEKFNVTEIQRVLSKNLIGEDVIVEGRVHAIEEVKQAVKVDIFECADCGVIYEDKIKTCTVKACRSQRIKRILNKETLEDHRFMQLTLFTKENQQEGDVDETRVWVSLDGRLAHTDLALSDSVKVEGRVLVAKSQEKGVVGEIFETFLYIKAKKVRPITDRKNEADIITPEERNEFKKWAEEAGDQLLPKLCEMYSPHIFGQDLVKESVLYQITGAGYEGNINRGDIHILIIGDPSEGKTELAMPASRIADGEYSSGEGISEAGIAAGLVHDKATGRMVVEAGIAVRGNRRLKALDEIDKMDKKYLRQLLSIMDKGFYKLDKVKHSLFETVGPWLCTGNPKEGRYNDQESIIKNIGFPAPILTRFDLIFILKRLYDYDKTAKRLERINKQYAVSQKEIADKEAWLKRYLKVAKEPRKIKIEPEVFEMLSEFYHKLEKAAEIAKGGIPITERQYHGMIRMAIARARLHLRNKVTKEDGVRAIEIMSVMMKMVGIDPETGEIDMNILRGKPLSETKRKEAARAFMQELQGGSMSLNLNTSKDEE